MQKIQAYLCETAALSGIQIESAQADQFQHYFELLTEWNQKMNLTAITEPQEVVVKHFVDSLLLLSYVPKESANLIDVGTGAGFPGIPLKIMRPDLSLTLMDSLNKRLTFLQEVTGQLGFDAEIVHLRAEEGGRIPQYRQKYAIATARAVASLRVLCEYCLPFVKMGGEFLAMKGPGAQQEVHDAEHAIEELGGELVEFKQYALPNGEPRSLVRIRRTKVLQPCYPRHGGKITKSPL